MPSRDGQEFCQSTSRMNTKIYTLPRRQTMVISKLGQRRQVVIPKEILRRARAPGR